MIIDNQLLKIVPIRIVVIGSNGFIGSHVSDLIEQRNIPILKISRDTLDLSSVNASQQLISILKKDDILLIAAANAPVKNNQMLNDNINMMTNIIDALEKVNLKRIIYVSSDAVYSDIKKPMNENSLTEPSSLHGIMHLTREIMLKNIADVHLSILRPTLIYGFKDPHNGYGPNQFFKLASKGKEIVLFGKGEENRDHICVYDVAQLVVKVMLSNHRGILNIASGKIITFKKIADKINKFYSNKIIIKDTIRNGKMPHDGYRSFNIKKIKDLFPNYKITPITRGLTSYFKHINKV